MIKVKDGYAKLIETKYQGSPLHLLRSNGGEWEVKGSKVNVGINLIVSTDENAQLWTSYINTACGNTIATGEIKKIYCSMDNYIRWASPANFFSDLNNEGNLLSITVANLKRNLTVLYATIAAYPLGFTGRSTTSTWGTLNAANGYTAVCAWPTPLGGAIGFWEKDTTLSVLIDGFFYLNEGQYLCLDTNNYSNTLDTRYVKKTGDTMTGELVSTNANSFRMAWGDHWGTIFRLDNSNFYILLTNLNDLYGMWNSYRPFLINFATGEVRFGTNVRAERVIQSTVALGTAPFTIASSTLVNNLNADLLDGYHALNIGQAGWINLPRNSTQRVWIKLVALTTTYNDNLENDTVIEFELNGDQNYINGRRGTIFCTSYRDTSRSVTLVSRGVTQTNDSHVAVTLVPASNTAAGTVYVFLGVLAKYTGRTRIRVLRKGANTTVYDTPDYTTSLSNAVSVTDNGGMRAYFDGSSWTYSTLGLIEEMNISGNATTATTLQTARTLTIGNTGKLFNGSANVAWSLAEIGALPTAGGVMTGSIVLKGATSPDMSYSGNVHPCLRFDNADSSLNISLIFTDYDSYRHPAGIKLVGNQGSEWFEAPYIHATRFYGALSGNATSATQLQTARTLWGLSFDGTANVSGNMSSVGDIVTTPMLGRRILCNGPSYTWGLHMGTGGVNRGIFDFTSSINAWLLYFDSANTILNYGSTYVNKIIKNGGNISLFLMADGSVTTKKVSSAICSSGWTGNAVDDYIIPTMSFIAHWNGSYNDASSNLQFCKYGRFGDVVTLNYVKANNNSPGAREVTVAYKRGTYTTLNQYFGNGNVVTIDPRPTDDTTNTTSANVTILSLGDTTTRNTQLAFLYDTDTIRYRRCVDGPTWKPWQTLLHTGNYLSYIKSYLDSNYVTLNTVQTINKSKTFNEYILVNSSIIIGQSGYGTARPATGIDAKGVRGNMAENDQWAIWGYGSGSNAGYMEIATGDDGNEPIYVAQYHGGPPWSASATRTHSITLLDAAGQSWFGNVYVAKLIKNGGTASQFLMANGDSKELTTLDSRYLKIIGNKFALYNTGTYTKILEFTITSGSLTPSITFSYIPTETNREHWADFNITIRDNNIMFFANWNGLGIRLLWCVGDGTTFAVWVLGTKTSWDPYGLIQIRHVESIISYKYGGLAVSDTVPSGTYKAAVDTGGIARVAMYPRGFTSRILTSAWGTLNAANGYTAVSCWTTPLNGEIGFWEKGSALSVQIDGFFYQNEGKYMCLDTNNYPATLDVRYVTALGTTDNALTWTKNGVANSLTIPFASRANYLTRNDNYSYSASGVSWFDISGTAGAAVQVNDTPTFAWWHILRFNHSNSNGYYTDVAVPFNDLGFYYKIIRNGSVVGSKWYKVLDDQNYSFILDNRYVKKSGDTMTGTLTAVHFYESSDRTLKENIEEISDSSNIPKLKRFNWKQDKSLSYGVIALELEELGYDELVNTDPNGVKTVNYTATLSLIIAKLQLKIDELENELNRLKNG